MGAFDGRRQYQLPLPPTIRADRIDQVRQEFESLVKDLDPIDAQVAEMLWRVMGSGAAVQHKGARFLDVSKLDDSAKGTLESEARYALRRLIQRNDIQLLSAVADTDSDWAEVVVDYINNRAAATDKKRQVRVRVPEQVKHGQT